MKALKTLFKIEFKRSIREFSGVLFGLILPVGLMVLLGTLYGDQKVDGQGYTFLQQAFPGVITIGICATGLMGIPITLSAYRDKQILKSFQVTPSSPFILLMAQFFNQMIFAFVSGLLVWLAASLFFHYRMIGNISHFLLAYLLVLFSIYGIGMMIASISKNVNMANLLCSFVYFPMFFLSGATVPYEIMPRGLQVVADTLPLTHGIKLLKDVSLGKSLFDQGFIALILFGLAIVTVVISVKTFKYDYE